MWCTAQPQAAARRSWLSGSPIGRRGPWRSRLQRRQFGRFLQGHYGGRPDLEETDRIITSCGSPRGAGQPRMGSRVGWEWGGRVIHWEEEEDFF